MVYEGHLTIYPVQPQYKYIVEGMGLSYSEIHNDPDLGKGIRAYATFHRGASLAVEWVIEDLNKYCTDLQNSGVSVVRIKIEVVIYDRRITP